MAGRAGQEVYMQTTAIREMVKKFKKIAETLQTVAKMLEALNNTLKATAFVGLVGGYALIHFINTMKPFIEQTAEKCENLSQDLDQSVAAYEAGDEQGATRFY